MDNMVGLVAVGISHTYEACRAQDVVAGRRCIESFSPCLHMEAHTNVVRRGCKSFAQVPRRHYGRGWLFLNFDVIGKCLWATGRFTLAAVGIVALEPNGLAIGGAMSVDALQANVGAGELLRVQQPTPQQLESLRSYVREGYNIEQCIAWRRYMDVVV